MSEILAVLAPCMVLAFGGLVCLAAEAFISTESKHRVLPWIGSIWTLLAGLALVLVFPQELRAIGECYVLDPARAWLQAAVLAAVLAGMAGLQHSLGRDRFPGGEPYALTLLSGAGVMLMVSANHYIGLFVGLELASIAIYACVGARRHRLESGEGLLKYLVMGAVFSAVFLYGVALCFGATGSFVYGNTVLLGREMLFFLGQTLIMLGLLFKVGAVPFHFWSPDAYAGAPIATTGYMAAVMKIGGFAALGAVWLNLVAERGPTSLPLALDATVALDAGMLPQLGALLKILAGVAVLSLLVGNFTALTQSGLRRLMAYSSISHAGYMLLALSLPADGSTLALGSLWYYLIAYAVAQAAALALLAGCAGPDDSDRLSDLYGLGRRRPAAGLLLTILIASLAGLPPTAGFFGKFLILSELVQKGQLLMAALAMLLAVVGAIYYLRLLIATWSADEADALPRERIGGLAYAVAVLACLITFGLLAGIDQSQVRERPPLITQHQPQP